MNNTLDSMMQRIHARIDRTTNEIRSPQHCDNCAGDIGTTRCWYEAIIYGEEVRLCSSQCKAQLYAVWAPSQRRQPVTQMLACLALVMIVL